MLLHDDVICQILLWLPVISLLRLKLACRSWRAMIESSYFIKQHLHLHHYDPSLKDKNRNLIYKLLGFYSPITFQLTSIEGFEEPNACLQLNCSDLHGCFPIQLRQIVSYNGIICLNLFHYKGGHSICLWNPATKQSRVLPQSPFHDKTPLSIGFGYDIKSNDYKVAKLIESSNFSEKRIGEVYSLNTGSWRSLDRGLSFFNVSGNIRMPFNNGTCFFWVYTSFKNKGILCFDFSSEMFRCIPLPRADYHPWFHHMNVANDKMACVITVNNHQSEMWVFNGYGTVNEAWTKLYTIDTYFLDRQYPIVNEGVSTYGNYVFFTTLVQMCRFNVVTKETSCFTLHNMPCCPEETLVGFKESLVSVGEGNGCTHLH